jgi:site-specific recombinase XerD
LTNNRFIKSSDKFVGIYHKELANGDLTYYITYKLKNGKKEWLCVGKKSDNITIPFCSQLRTDAINNLKFGSAAASLIKYRQKAGVTLNDTLDKFLNSRDLSKKPKEAYYHTIKIFNEITKKTQLNDINTDDINKFKNALKESKSFTTINHSINRLSALFNFAIDRGILETALNPCKSVIKLKTDNQRSEYLTRDEVTTLKEAIKDKPILLLFVELSLSTGGRLETITSIAKKDINLAQKTILLRNHKAKNDYTGFISDGLLPLLKERYEAITNPNERLVTTSSRTIQKQLQPLLNKLFNEGLDTRDAKNRVVIHTLRHTFASHLAIQGTPIFTIMKLLDHKDIKDTLRYAKLCDKNGFEAVKGLWNEQNR